MTRVIYGRHVAIRMAIISVIVLVTGFALAAVFADPEFIFFGFVGALGSGISTVVALAGQDLRAAPAAQQREDWRGPGGEKD